MARDQLPRPTSVPIRFGQGATSSPLQDVQIYRPGPYIVIAILVLPALVTLGGAALYLNTSSQIPGWLPFVLLLWLPGIPVLWLSMLTVRTSTVSIASGRPWSRWVEIYWQDVERVEQRGLFVRLQGAQGGHITFVPGLLREGKRLERHLLLRLSSHVLTGRFASKGQGMLASDIRSTPGGGYSGTLTIQVRPRVRWSLAVSSLLSTVAAVYLLAVSRASYALPLGIAMAAVAFAACTILLWTLQSVRINETGVSLGRVLIPASRHIAWSDVELIEYSPGEAFLRFRGAKRLLSPGPGLLTTAQATLMRGFLTEYAGKRKIPMLERRWLLPW